MEIKEFLNEKGIEDETLQSMLEEYADVKWKDKYLRLAADFDNFKRRSNDEKNDIRLKEKVNSLNSILELDNELEIAFKMIPDESKHLFQIFMDKMTKILKSNGVETIQTDEYDSDIHEVIQVIETGEEKIHDVVSKGYKLGDKVIKYPKIVLSK
jgi:molecular chaperone GrpE